MPKGPRGEQRPADVIGNAVMIAKIATGEIEDTRYAQPAKVRSGKAGAKARAEKLTGEERSEIAKKAASGRWG
ncbi:MAG: RNA-binding protein [Pseudomonadota bacterium]